MQVAREALGDDLVDFLTTVSRLAAVKKQKPVQWELVDGPCCAVVEGDIKALAASSERRARGEKRREAVGSGWFLAEGERTFFVSLRDQRQLERAADLIVVEAKRRSLRGKAYYVVTTGRDRRDHLFPSCSVRAQLKLDDEGSFSASDEVSARKTAALARRLGSSVVDATASIGGNTFEFARVFDDVIAIELDETRFHMLQFNCELLELAVACVHGDCKDELKNVAQGRVVFFDPPFGGRGYRFKTLHITLGDTSLPELCDLCQSNGASHALFKLPAAYDDAVFGSRKLQRHTISAKIKLLVVDLLDEPRRRKKRRKR